MVLQFERRFGVFERQVYEFEWLNLLLLELLQQLEVIWQKNIRHRMSLVSRKSTRLNINGHIWDGRDVSSQIMLWNNGGKRERWGALLIYEIQRSETVAPSRGRLLGCGCCSAPSAPLITRPVYGGKAKSYTIGCACVLESDYVVISVEGQVSLCKRDSFWKNTTNN